MSATNGYGWDSGRRPRCSSAALVCDRIGTGSRAGPRSRPRSDEIAAEGWRRSTIGSRITPRICWRAGGRSSASIPSATNSSGAGRCVSTRRSKARASAASAPASARPRRWRSGSRSTPKRCPPATLLAIRQGRINLNDPAVTLALLDADAVVGLVGEARTRRRLAHDRHHVRLVSFDRRQRGGARHRTPARWLAESRSERRRDHRSVARSERGRRLCWASISRRYGPCSRAGDRGSSTRSCSWTERRSVRTARARRRCFRRRSAWPASICTPTPGGAAWRTGTRSSPISRCTGRARSSTRA